VRQHQPLPLYQIPIHYSIHSQAAVQFGQSLFPLFALALDLPENFFDDKVGCFYGLHS
jgi:isopenicillin N synthase-like dioxygenase